MDIEQINVSTKRIEARIKLDYKDIVENIIDDKSLPISNIMIWLLNELVTLQKYILVLLIERIQKEIDSMRF